MINSRDEKNVEKLDILLKELLNPDRTEGRNKEGPCFWGLPYFC